MSKIPVVTSFSKSRSLFQIAFAIFVALSLQACATHNLWKDHAVRIESDPLIVGKSDELFINLKDSKLCIPFIPGESNQSKQYLVAEVDKDYRLDLLKDVLLNEPAFQLEAMVVNAQDCLSRYFGSYKSLGIYLLGDISDDHVIFEKDNANYNAIPKNFDIKKELGEYIAASQVHCIDMAGADGIAQIKRIIKEKWFKRFGEQFNGSAYPIGCKSTKGEIDSMFENTKVAGIVNELIPPVNGIKYIEILFNMNKYRSFWKISETNNKAWYPAAIKNYVQEYPLYFYFDAPVGYPYFGGIFPPYKGAAGLPSRVKEYYYSYDVNSCTGESVKISRNNFTFNIYHNTIEEKKEYDNSLSTRIIGTPFTVAFDILTSPVQLALFV